MDEGEDKTVGDPDLAARLDALAVEIRRQGRAAVSAQAAAEATLEKVRELAAALPDPRPPARPAASSPERDQDDWLRALIPVFDAFDSWLSQAQALEREMSRTRWLGALPPLRRVGSQVRAFAEGVALLGAQLERALGEVGVVVDRQAGVTVDPLRHRVVEVKPGPATREAQVLQVLRPGYARHGRCLREAEVRASATGRASGSEER